MANPGKLVIVAMFALAILAVGFSTWYHYQNAHRSLDYWGTERASLIATAPEITVFEVTADPNVPIDPAAIGTDVPTIIDAGITYRVRASKSADKARGVSNIRRALVLDTTYDWQDPPAADYERHWGYAMRFRDGANDAIVLFDLPVGLVSTSGGKVARLNATAAADLGLFFREQFSPAQP